MRDGTAVQRGPAVPGERFKTLKDRLGDAFEVIEINSRKGNEHGFGKMAHSVLTLEVREVDGHPAYEARKRVVEFLTRAADVAGCCGVGLPSASASTRLTRRPNHPNGFRRLGLSSFYRAGPSARPCTPRGTR